MYDSPDVQRLATTPCSPRGGRPGFHDPQPDDLPPPPTWDSGRRIGSRAAPAGGLPPKTFDVRRLGVVALGGFQAVQEVNRVPAQPQQMPPGSVGNRRVQVHAHAVREFQPQPGRQHAAAPGGEGPDRRQDKKHSQHPGQGQRCAERPCHACRRLDHGYAAAADVDQRRYLQQRNDHQQAEGLRHASGQQQPRQRAAPRRRGDQIASEHPGLAGRVSAAGRGAIASVCVLSG